MSVLEQLLAELQAGQKPGVGFKHDTAGTPSMSNYLHGPGGLLTYPGLDPTIFSAMLGGHSLLRELPATPSLFMNPMFAILTGQQADIGSEKTTTCGDPPTAGLTKACMHQAPFGMIERGTPELEISRLGQRLDRSDPMDLRLVGTPMSETGMLGGGPGGMGAIGAGDVLTNEVTRRFRERNISIDRVLMKEIWTGNPANNVGNAQRHPAGLDLLVATGYKDAETGTACPAADSYVRNFGSARIDSNPTRAVAEITNMYYQVKDRADRSGVGVVRWAIAMRPQLFYELTAIWPCGYLTNRCITTGADVNVRALVDGRDQANMRDEMRRGKFLWVDGDQIEVVTDDGMTELNGNETGAIPRGCFSTDIFFLPMSVGGISTLYLEYFQYNNPAVQDTLGNLFLGKIEGAFFTWIKQTNTCFQWFSRLEERIVLRTPWLAARLQNVAYCPIDHTNDTFPEEPYFKDGGKTGRAGPSFNNLWGGGA